MAERLEDRILEYLSLHPAAMDTAEGIRAWWLPSDVPASASDVEAAVAALLRSGHLKVWSDTRSRVYGLAEGVAPLADRRKERGDRG